MKRRPRVLFGGGLLLAGALGLVCCVFMGPSEEELTQIRAALAKPEVLLLDVRSPEEFSTGHLTSAVNVPVGELGVRLAELGAKERPVVVYCRSGRRSARAAGLLADAGFTSVLDLGGIGNGEDVALVTTTSR